MASIEKRSENSVRITVSAGCDSAGKKLVHRKTVKRPANVTDRQWEKELQKLALEFERAVEKGTYLDGSKLTFAEFTERWLTSYTVELAPKTTYRYREMLDSRVLPAIGHIKLDKLQPIHLLDFYKNLREEGIRLDTKYAATPKFHELYIKEKLTQRKLMELAQISESTASRIVNGRSIMHKSAQKISKALELEFKILFKPSSIPGRLSDNTISHHHKLISSILQTAVEWQVIMDNPASRVKTPTFKKKPIKYYEEEQIKALLKAIDSEEPKYQAMVMLLTFTGVRLGELMGINWSDVDFENNVLEISKASQYLPGKGTFEKGTKTETSTRKVTVPSLVISFLKEYRKKWIEQRLSCGDLWQNSDRLFVTWDGRPMYTYTLTGWFPKFLEKHNLPKITPHGLRHSMASLLGSQGIEVAAVSKRLGHAKVSTTLDIYMHVFKKADTVASDLLEKVLLEDSK